MEIKSTVIKAQASLNYQVGAVEIEISNYTAEEFNQVENYVITKAKEICNKLAGAEVKEEPKVAVQTEYKRATFVPKAPLAAQNEPNLGDARASQSQLDFLKKLGYKGDFNNLTKQQASELIQQLKK